LGAHHEVRESDDVLFVVKEAVVEAARAEAEVVIGKIALEGGAGHEGAGARTAVTAALGGWGVVVYRRRVLDRGRRGRSLDWRGRRRRSGCRGWLHNNRGRRRGRCR
jgi:hypothetical protein